jgi:hypothetical protein
VARVREEGEAAGEEAAGDLDHGECECQAEDEKERAS